MRLVHYYIVNRKTGERINAGCYRRRAEKIIASKTNQEDWFIHLHWLSI